MICSFSCKIEKITQPRFINLFTIIFLSNPSYQMKIAKRFARLFGQACGDFQIIKEDGTDDFMIPLDCDYLSLCLLHWLCYKNTKEINQFRITAIHFYETEEADSETYQYLSEFCNRLKIKIIFKKVIKPHDRTMFNQILVDAAEELGCNKIVLGDNLDFLNAVLLTNMCNGRFVCNSVVEMLKSGIYFVRPFCYLNNHEIQLFATQKGFPNRPTGISIKEDPFMETAHKAIEMLRLESANVKLNFFKSQFCVRSKYIGTGEESLMD